MQKKAKKHKAGVGESRKPVVEREVVSSASARCKWGRRMRARNLTLALMGEAEAGR